MAAGFGSTITGPAFDASQPDDYRSPLAFTLRKFRPPTAFLSHAERIAFIFLHYKNIIMKRSRKSVPMIYEFDAIMATLPALVQESDRGCALAATAWIDERLASLLHSRFRNDSGDNESLFEWLLWKQPVPPLQSTGVKSRLCRALGLIDERVYGAINKASEIRNNHFAHFAGPVSFKQPEIKRKVADLIVLIDDYSNIYQAFWKGRRSSMTVARRRFVAATAAIVLTLVAKERKVYLPLSYEEMAKTIDAVVAGKYGGPPFKNRRKRLSATSENSN